MSHLQISETEEFWRTDFGDEYLRRHKDKLDWTTRIPFWAQIVVACKAEIGSALEVGCSSGTNLRALRQVDPRIRLTGIDINTLAVLESVQAGFEVYEGSAQLPTEMWEGHSDLVFTCGLLIHIPPADIEAVMRGIIAASRKYVLAVEYAAEAEEEIEYRGHAGRLWKRPFGLMYRDLGLQCVSASDAGSGFDQCRAWLCVKT